MRRRHSFVKKAKDFKALKQYKTIMKIQSLLTELEKNQEDFKREEGLVLDSRKLLEVEEQFVIGLCKYKLATNDFKKNHGKNGLNQYLNSPISPLVAIQTIDSSTSKLLQDVNHYAEYYKSHKNQVIKSERNLEEKKGKVNALGEKVENLLKEQPLNRTIPESPPVEECAVCLCPYDTENHKHSAITTCGHRFGSSCLRHITNKRCPICFQQFKLKNIITLY